MEVHNVKVTAPTAAWRRCDMITQMTISDDTIAVDLTDGRSISAPLAWYPRLLHGTTDERNTWRLIGAGSGVHWPDLDEDISVGNLIAGQPSGESQASLQRWLVRRTVASGD
jgi:hypothetical protein